PTLVASAINASRPLCQCCALSKHAIRKQLAEEQAPFSAKLCSQPISVPSSSSSASNSGFSDGMSDWMAGRIETEGGIGRAPGLVSGAAADLMPERVQSKAVINSPIPAQLPRRLGRPRKNGTPITAQPADQGKPTQLGNFASAHLGRFESALTPRYLMQIR